MAKDKSSSPKGVVAGSAVTGRSAGRAPAKGAKSYVVETPKRGVAPRPASVVVRNATTGLFVNETASKRTKAAAVEVTARGTVSSKTVRSVAERITGSKAAAERWYDRPNDLLGGRTPKKAVKDGDEKRVVGLLLTVAGQ